MDRRHDPVVELLTEIELKPVRPGRGSGTRARLLLAAWLLGLAGVAGFAVMGRLPGPLPEPEPITYAEPPITPAKPPSHANPPSAAEVRPTLGDDGLMGGLVYPDG